MKLYYGIGAMLSAMMADASIVASFKQKQIADFSKPKTYRTGKKYPFSSKRQNERFARQLAAGKVKFV